MKNSKNDERVCENDKVGWHGTKCGKDIDHENRDVGIMLFAVSIYLRLVIIVFLRNLGVLLL